MQLNMRNAIHNLKNALMKYNENEMQRTAVREANSTHVQVGCVKGTRMSIKYPHTFPTKTTQQRYIQGPT
jgi:hypothetical protein